MNTVLIFFLILSLVNIMSTVGDINTCHKACEDAHSDRQTPNDENTKKQPFIPEGPVAVFVRLMGLFGLMFMCMA